jgi:hypothetical protein
MYAKRAGKDMQERMSSFSRRRNADKRLAVGGTPMRGERALPISHRRAGDG